MKNCKNRAHDILGNDDEICQLCAETETETQTKQEWEKRFDALYYGSTCGGDGLFNSDLYLDIKQFISQELHQAELKAEERVESVYVLTAFDEDKGRVGEVIVVSDLKTATEIQDKLIKIYGNKNVLFASRNVDSIPDNIQRAGSTPSKTRKLTMPKTTKELSEEVEKRFDKTFGIAYSSKAGAKLFQSLGKTSICTLEIKQFLAEELQIAFERGREAERKEIIESIKSVEYLKMYLDKLPNTRKYKVYLKAEIDGLLKTLNTKKEKE